MTTSSNFIRVLFVFLSLLILTTYTTTALEGGLNALNIALGLFFGSVIGMALITTDSYLKKFTLLSLNISSLGLFSGYLLGTAIVAILNAAIEPQYINESAFNLIKSIIYLSSCYLGVTLVAHASEDFYLSIPFVKFKAVTNKKKDILIDSSILLDPRFIDLAASGLLNNHLILPRFTLKDLYFQAENGDENLKAKARRSLEVCKKLETLPNLNLSFSETDFPEIKDPINKLTRHARLSDANIITADISRIQQSSIEGIVIININSLSNALKPLTQTGEHLNIKIQRFGKEARQGVGYLEDGTMVVVNGGAEHIGETIKAQVLSVKHTSSGRMIFCNSMDESLNESSETDELFSNYDQSHKNYFAVDSSKL
jgi:uncharacterized protein YacL